MDTIAGTLKRMQEIHDAAVMDITAYQMVGNTVPLESFINFFGAKMWEAFGWITPFWESRIDHMLHTVVRANKLVALRYMASAHLPAIRDFVKVTGIADMYVLIDPSWKIFHIVYKNRLVMVYTQDLEIIGAEIFVNAMAVSSFTVLSNPTISEPENYSEFARELEYIWANNFEGKQLYYPTELDNWLEAWID